MKQMLDSIQTTDYSIHLGSIADSIHHIDLSAYSKICVVVDENTRRDCYPILAKALNYDHEVLEIPAGEIHKNIDTCLYIWREMLAKGLDRKSLCINLGGGVLCDMGGFSAACFMRGIDFVHIPTTLLSQVDASIGGKLGVDLDHMKNLVGLIQNPRAVLIDPQFLHTLSDREFRSGYAEIIKHGLIADASYYSDATGEFPPLDTNLHVLILQSLQIKNSIVTEDPKERSIRKLLNFGHTVGHAVESLSLMHDVDPLLHGEAIAVGMICEAHIAYQKGKICNDTLLTISESITEIYGRYDLSTKTTESIWTIMLHDKKNDAGTVLCTLLDDIGSGCYNVAIKRAELREAIAYYTK